MSLGASFTTIVSVSESVATSDEVCAALGLLHAASMAKSGTIKAKESVSCFIYAKIKVYVWQMYGIY